MEVKGTGCVLGTLCASLSLRRVIPRETHVCLLTDDLTDSSPCCLHPFSFTDILWKNPLHCVTLVKQYWVHHQ